MSAVTVFRRGLNGSTGESRRRAGRIGDAEALVTCPQVNNLPPTTRFLLLQD